MPGIEVVPILNEHVLIVLVIQNEKKIDVMHFNKDYDKLSREEAIKEDPETAEMDKMIQEMMKYYCSNYEKYYELDEKQRIKIYNKIIKKILKIIKKGEYQKYDANKIVAKLETDTNKVHRECIDSIIKGNKMEMDGIPESATPDTSNPRRSGRGRISKKELQRRKHAPINKAMEPQRKRRRCNPEPLPSKRFVIRTCRFTHTVYNLFLD